MVMSRNVNVRYDIGLGNSVYEFERNDLRDWVGVRRKISSFYVV